jgi:hypothetical protein
MSTKIILNSYSYIGLGSEPMFSSFLPAAMESDVKWGTGNPPGGPGTCMVQYQGAFYNASCDQESHFSCQEKPGSGSDG